MTKLKIQEAKKVIESCIGKNGVWAGANRYRYQCWTRDFIVSLPTLLDLGFSEISRKHFVNIFKRQNKNGEIPVLFADNFIKLLFKKIFDAIRKRRISFVLKRMIWPGLSKLSPGTRDVDALCILGLMEYAETTSDKKLLERYRKQIDLALSYIDNNLIDQDGLLVGADWRDMLEDELKDKTLLSNNAILYELYKKIGRQNKAEALKEQINKKFWNGSYYIDHPKTNDFDTYGQSLAILFDIVPRDRYGSIVKKYKDVSMPFGFRINDIFPKPTTEEERRVVERIKSTTNQFNVVWPYINAFAILALRKIGEFDLANKQWESWNKLDGFCEWYDPETGQGFGDTKQLWSAALYLRVAKALPAY
jgi:glycogen debranching enzyme